MWKGVEPFPIETEKFFHTNGNPCGLYRLHGSTGWHEIVSREYMQTVPGRQDGVSRPGDSIGSPPDPAAPRVPIRILARHAIRARPSVATPRHLTLDGFCRFGRPAFFGDPTAAKCRAGGLLDRGVHDIMVPKRFARLSSFTSLPLEKAPSSLRAGKNAPAKFGSTRAR